jgi:hypothetical protein
MALIATPATLAEVQLLQVFTETVVFSDDTPPEDPPPDPPTSANTGNVLSVSVSTSSPTVNVAFSNTIWAGLIFNPSVFLAKLSIKVTSGIFI